MGIEGMNICQKVHGRCKVDSWVVKCQNPLAGSNFEKNFASFTFAVMFFLLYLIVEYRVEYCENHWFLFKIKEFTPDVGLY